MRLQCDQLDVSPVLVFEVNSGSTVEEPREKSYLRAKVPSKTQVLTSSDCSITQQEDAVTPCQTSTSHLPVIASLRGI